MQHTAPGYNKVNVQHPCTVKDIDGTIQVRFNAEKVQSSYCTVQPPGTVKPRCSTAVLEYN